MLNFNNYQVGITTSQTSNQTGRTGNFNDMPQSVRATAQQPVTVTASNYQPSNYQLLQQPTDAHKFMSSWQPSSSLTSNYTSSIHTTNTQTSQPVSTIPSSFPPTMTTTFRPTQFEPVTSVRPANIPPINSGISNTSYINQNSFSVGSSFQSPTFQTKAFDPAPSSNFPSNPPTKPLDTFGPSPSSFNSSLQNNVRYTDSL